MTRTAGPPTGWRLACPSCRAELGVLNYADHVETSPDLECPRCGERLAWHGGMLDARPKPLRDMTERFLNEYGTVRRAEGRGCDDPEWYWALPFVPSKDPLARQWAIRARSWQCLDRRLLRRLPGGKGLDLGAGVGWLSARMAKAGWDMLAIDLSDDARDGLGAASHYASQGKQYGQPPFCRMLAHFDHLPLADGQADVVVFNASFHYSPDFEATLAEAMRVLSPGGRIVILDTPSYRSRASGELMVRQRRADFKRRFGFASDTLGSREFLLEGELDSLGAKLGIEWRRIRPNYGLAWRARPLLYRLARKRREPANFALWIGQGVL